MRLELHYRSDVDLSQPGMQVEIRNHIARCLREYPNGCEGVITLAGIEHCFMYVVNDDVVDTVIGPPNYIQQVFNERRQNADEAPSPMPREEHNQPGLGASPAFETRQNELAQERAAAAPPGIGAGADGLKGRRIYSYRLRLRRIASLFIGLGRICDAALLDVLGESSRAKPRQPRRTLGSATRRFGLWGRATEGRPTGHETISTLRDLALHSPGSGAAICAGTSADSGIVSGA